MRDDLEAPPRCGPARLDAEPSALHRQLRPRVYAAHPLTSYASPHAATQLAGLARALPAAELVDPESLAWTDDAAWSGAWPGLLATLDALVVFADRDGTVGAGCAQECLDALVAGLPVAAWQPGIGLVELVGVALLPCGLRSPRRLAWLAIGPRIPPGDFPAARSLAPAVRR